jgi:hypothetical protein
LYLEEDWVAVLSQDVAVATPTWNLADFPSMNNEETQLQHVLQVLATFGND